MSGRFVVKKIASGQFHFTLEAAHHHVIATSQGYVSESARDAGIASVKNSGTTATIEDST